MSPEPRGRVGRVVIDTNVWLSAWLSREGRAAAAVVKVLTEGVALFSAATFDELQTRCWRPKFDRYWSLEQRRRLLADASAAALWVEPPESLMSLRASRDPDDDKFLQLALAADANWLVTGDADLLVLEASGGTSIVSPAQFLEAVSRSPG
jgi:putative PIN family toxin of toxin-antitoxin system